MTLQDLKENRNQIIALTGMTKGIMSNMVDGLSTTKYTDVIDYALECVKNYNSVSFSKNEIVKETESAILLNVVGTFSRSQNCKGFGLWIPKSVISNNTIAISYILSIKASKGVDFITFRSAKKTI